MEATNRIILNSSLNKKSVNSNESLNINLSGNKKLLPEDGIGETIDSYDVYLEERKNSNKFRLIININPYCTNVLFNPFTEVIRNEGSDEAYCLNFASEEERTTSYINLSLIKSEKAIIGKADEFVWDGYQAIRDTQLSNEFCGFNYNCGIDIFNNHVIRNKTLKSVNYHAENSEKEMSTLESVYGTPYHNVRINNPKSPHKYIDDNFNTIDDYMRDRNGVVISEHFSKYVEDNPNNLKNQSYLDTFVMPLHLYQGYDIYSFSECTREKLIEENGWFGFKNPSIISSMSLVDGALTTANYTTTFDVDTEHIHCCVDSEGGYTHYVSVSAVQTENKQNHNACEMLINKTINNKKYCEFIDMYPGRDLYSFYPKYNKNRRRLENNWNYCLTYPSENIIRQAYGNFPFFRIDDKNNVSLKALMFDEYTLNDSGVEVLTVYSICRHGLVSGDYVNIYKGDDIFYDSVKVTYIVDNFTFQVKKDTSNMSDEWIELDDNYANATYKYNGKIYPVCGSHRCNVDENAQDIHFRRVVNGVECKYYVRKFSRLPNFKFKDTEVNDFTLYSDKSENSLIRRFSDPSRKTSAFENHISKLGFAETSYGDDVVEIVYTDDIDVSYLRDNLGRPISDVYLTIVKNNKGYKEWYGIGTSINIKNNPDIEYSHCFGKINCGFLLSNFYRDALIESRGNKIETFGDNIPMNDVRDITVEENNKGLTNLNNASLEDEISFETDFDFYGDLCCYSPVDCDEQIIQSVMNRFNTAQRELLSYGNSEAFNHFNKGVLYYDEIRDVESNLLYGEANQGDPYDDFRNGLLMHSEKKEGHNMLSYNEGYYYQAHYRIPIKTVSRSLSYDSAIKYVIYEINRTNTMSNGREVFEFKTVDNNDFVRNEKIVLYKKSTNEYFFVTVYLPLSSTNFYCFIEDEGGNRLDNIDNLVGETNVNDYLLLKKHIDTPYYARLIKDGSCRYCWREIKANGLEDEDKIYPFTNGAFYVTKQINFFLRRQDPNNHNLAVHENTYRYTPNGEKRTDYYDINATETYYESEENKEC